MFCTNCGVKIAELDAFCSHCGARTATTPAGQPEAVTRLTRSIYDSKIAGVCGGLAQYLNLDPTLVRLFWVVVSICFPPLLLGYIAAWIIVPKEAPRLMAAYESGVPQPNI